MKYLHIKAESASLIVEKLKKDDIPDNVKTRCDELTAQFPNDKFSVFGGDDILHPVRMTNASNMLAAFCNIRTVPTKPMVYNKISTDINLKRSRMCDDIASTGYVKLNSYVENESFVEQVIGDDGNFYNIYRNSFHPNGFGAELFKGEKLAIDSNRRDYKASFFDGEEPISGSYDYQTLLWYFMDDYNHPLYVKIRGFINEILNTEDFQKEYTFKEMANALYKKRQESSEIDERINEFVNSIKDEWDDVAKSNGQFTVYDEKKKKNIIKKGSQGCFPIWMYAIFHQGSWTKSGNISSKSNGLHSSTHMRLSRDVDHFKIPVDMELIFKVDDSRFEDALRNGRGVATLLDGGVCEIVGLTNFEPVTNYEENWIKIQ